MNIRLGGEDATELIQGLKATNKKVFSKHLSEFLNLKKMIKRDKLIEVFIFQWFVGYTFCLFSTTETIKL